MSFDDDAAREALDSDNRTELTLEQLRGFQQGIAVTIMPVRDGWRVHYFSITDFDDEPGTTFPSFEAALAAVEEVLPAVNSPEERERADRELRQRLRDSTESLPEINESPFPPS